MTNQQSIMPNRPGVLMNKSVALFCGNDKRLDHFCATEVAIVFDEFFKPEIEAILIRISAQVTEVFHLYKRRVVFSVIEHRMFSYRSQNLGSRFRAGIKRIDIRISI